MKKILLILLITLINSPAFCQSKADSIEIAKMLNIDKLAKRPDRYFFGPVPYRTLEETVGEEYMVLPLDSGMKKFGYTYMKAQGSEKRLYSKDIEGKLLVLKSVTKDSAYFADSDGNKYVSVIAYNHTIANIAPLAEFKFARKLYLNKTLWIKTFSVKVGNHRDVINTETKNAIFEPVHILDIVPSTSNSYPLVFIIKTSDGTIGYTVAAISKTNTDRDPDFDFYNRFYIKDPKLIYKYPPATWANLKKNKIVVGMTEEQVLLIRKDPDQVNKVVVGGKVYKDWIYMEPKYHSYLFLNGKVTMVKE